MSEKKSTMLQQRILVDESPSGSQDVEGTSASTFAGKVVVSNLTCQLRAGSLTVIVGMTGAGKSSLLQGVLLGEVAHSHYDFFVSTYIHTYTHLDVN